MKTSASHRPFHGLVAAPFTPLAADGSANTEVIPGYAQLLSGNGVGAAFICGTTGESLSLTIEDRLAMAEKWLENSTESFRVIVHVGHSSLKESCRLARHAAECGAPAISCMAPSFFKPSSLESLINWCERIAEAGAPSPFYYYHVPVMTGVQMPMLEFLEKACSRIPTLAGIKYTHDDLEEFSACLKFDGGRFDIPFGWDELLLESLERGATGAIGSSYNFSAPLYLEIIRAFHAGNHERARMLQKRALQMIEICAGSGVGYLATAKTLMKFFGVDCGPVLPPLTLPTGEQMAAVRSKLAAMHFDEFSCISTPSHALSACK